MPGIRHQLWLAWQSILSKSVSRLPRPHALNVQLHSLARPISNVCWLWPSLPYFWRSANLGAHHGTCHKGPLALEQHVRARTMIMCSLVVFLRSPGLFVQCLLSLQGPAA